MKGVLARSPLDANRELTHLCAARVIGHDGAFETTISVRQAIDFDPECPLGMPQCPDNAPPCPHFTVGSRLQTPGVPPIGLAVPRLAIKVPRLKPKVPRRNLEVPRLRLSVRHLRWKTTQRNDLAPCGLYIVAPQFHFVQVGAEHARRRESRASRSRAGTAWPSQFRSGDDSTSNEGELFRHPPTVLRIEGAPRNDPRGTARLSQKLTPDPPTPPRSGISQCITRLKELEPNLTKPIQVSYAAPTTSITTQSLSGVSTFFS